MDKASEFGKIHGYKLTLLKKRCRPSFVSDLLPPPTTTPSVPIYRSYIFLKKILKYKTTAKFAERYVRFVKIFY
jgi:hypothetical protein